MNSVLRSWVERWEVAVDAYLHRRVQPPDDMRPWFESYTGTGTAAPDLGGFPEPYIGALTPAPRMVTLGLNPGRTFPHLQAPDGLFADEIRELGSYQAWAATEPYMRYPWLRQEKSLYRRSRVRFMQRWHDEPNLLPSGLLVVEAYPWHSRNFDKGRYRPDTGVVREWVWDPVAATGTPIVFAFGAWWYDELPRWPGMEVIARLGRGGRKYGAVESRAVVVLRPGSGPPVVAEKHSGAATPPSPTEAARLREALAEVLP